MICANLLRPGLTALAAAIFLLTGLSLLIWPGKVQQSGERIEAWQFNTFPFLRRLLFVQIRLASWHRQLRLFPWSMRLLGLGSSLVGLFLGALLLIGVFNPCL